MRYLMKQKLLAFGSNYTIKNENDEPVFFVEGKAFSIGSKLSFQDMSGHELAFISQKVLSFKMRYEIYRAGQLFAEISHDIALFKDKYTVDVPGPNDYEVRGKFWEYEYSFYRGKREVAVVSKKHFSWANTYGIDIVDGEDDLIILVTAVVIDRVNSARNAGIIAASS